MSAFFSSMGNLAQGEGDAYSQQLAQQLARAQVGTEGAYKQASAETAAKAQALQEKEFEAGKWYLDRDSFAMPDGTPAPVMYNRITGEQRIPKGAVSTKSLGFQFNQLRNSLPPEDQAAFDKMDLQTKLMLLQKLNPYSGLSPVTIMGPGGPQQAMLAKGTNTVQPSQMAGGGPVAKPNPLMPVQTPEIGSDGKPTGNMMTTFVPKYGGAGSRSQGGATPRPTGAAPQQQAPGTYPQRGGILRSVGTVSAPTMAQIQRIETTKILLNDVAAALEQTNPATGKPYYMDSQGADKVNGIWQNFLYSHGIQPDQTWEEAIQKGTLLDFAGVQGLIPGLRRGDLIKDAMTHLPNRTDTMMMMYGKAKQMQNIYARQEQQLLADERANKTGQLIQGNLPPSPPKDSGGKTASAADVQAYAQQYNIPYGVALQQFQGKGYTIK